MGKTRSVCVLLATYNGEEFLEQQLASISEQVGVTVHVRAHDDGSSDRTLEILERWRNKGLVASITESVRIGPTASFFKLLAESSHENYVAFSDQDDVWDPLKLFKQLEVCESHNVRIPLLVICGKAIIDKDGKEIRGGRKIRKSPSLQNALIENIASGNTVLINKKGIGLLNIKACPDVVHYDAWVYLTIASFGICFYLPQSLVKYRIHDKNLIGIRPYGSLPRRESILQFLRQADYFQSIYGNSLPPESNKIINDFVQTMRTKRGWSRISQVARLKIERQSRLETLLVKIFLTSVSN